MSLGDLFPHGILPYVVGGLFIGAGIALVYGVTGRVAGISSVFSATHSWWSRRGFFQQPLMIDDARWKTVLVVGLMVGAGLYTVFFGELYTTTIAGWRLLLGGVVVGYGTRLARGCTSGHGICGIAAGTAPLHRLDRDVPRRRDPRRPSPRRTRRCAVKELGVVFLGGVVFGVGLALSGLTSQEIVLEFLRLEDLGLALAMGAALAVATPVYLLLPRLRARPLLRSTFDRLPRHVRPHHVIGGVVFGIGWGFAGVCPGAAIASLATGNAKILLAILGMSIGAYLQGVVAERAESPEPAGE